MKIAILGSGIVARFYADYLHSQRSKDFVITVYSRNIERAKSFSEDYFLQYFTDNMAEAVSHPEVDVVLICLPNHLHVKAVELCAAAKKHVLCTKPLGRTAAEAKRMLDMVETAGIFGGYLEDLCYTPKFIKSLGSVKNGHVGQVLRTKSVIANGGPHSNWVWDSKKSGGGAIIDLACNSIAISRNFIGKDVKPLEVMCWSSTQVYPIDSEDNAIGIVKYSNGAIGQFEVSWTFKAGIDLRDEVAGTEGNIWFNNFSHSDLEFSTAEKDGHRSGKAVLNNGWIFPGGDGSHGLGYANMFTDMFNAIENKRQPLETFYDGYVVNAILDAAFSSAKTQKWESVILEDWRGNDKNGENIPLISFNKDFYLVKEEVLPNGDLKTILKNKKSGEMVQHLW